MSNELEKVKKQEVALSGGLAIQTKLLGGSLYKNTRSKTKWIM